MEKSMNKHPNDKTICLRFLGYCWENLGRYIEFAWRDVAMLGPSQQSVHYPGRPADIWWFRRSWDQIWWENMELSICEPAEICNLLFLDFKSTCAIRFGIFTRRVSLDHEYRISNGLDHLNSTWSRSFEIISRIWWTGARHTQPI